MGCSGGLESTRGSSGEVTRNQWEGAVEREARGKILAGGWQFASCFVTCAWKEWLAGKGGRRGRRPRTRGSAPLSIRLMGRQWRGGLRYGLPPSQFAEILGLRNSRAGSLHRPPPGSGENKNIETKRG